MLTIEPQLIFALGSTLARENVAIKEVVAANPVKLATAFNKGAISCIVDFPPFLDDQLTYRYCCPICLRFFNRILASSCCKNYVCFLCFEIMMRKAISDSEYRIRCAHCLEKDFTLSDVLESDKIKYYTDTPYKKAAEIMDSTPGQANE